MSKEPRTTYDQRSQIIIGSPTNVAGDQHIHLPPLQSTRATPPAPPPDFVGREQQLANLTDLLTTGRTAAITALHGMGGIGKTALAQALAARLEPHFSGGIFWASLVDHNGSAEPILRTWGALCGADLSQEPDPAVLSDRVRGLFAMRRDAQGPLLVVIDDIREEWLTAAQVLKHTLLAGTPLLLTLRDVDLAGALEAEVVRLDVLPEPDAWTLLAARVKPPEILTPAETVKALLGHLGYLPLAIRLAAGYVSKFARKPGFDLSRFVEEVAQRAVGLLDAAGGSGLAATFAISYAALTTEQQHIFRHCSIYSPALLTVEHMAGLLDMAPSVVETALDELVAVALLDWDKTQPGRYQPHPLLKQYAYTLLSELEADVRTIHRLAATYLQQKLTGAGGTPVEVLEGVDQWEKAQEWENMASLTSALVENLDRLGYWDEIENRLSKAQRHLQGLPAREYLAATLWSARGLLAFKQARWNDAIAYHEQTLQTFEQMNNVHAIAKTKDNLGLVYGAKGEWNTAIVHHIQALQIFEKVDDSHAIAKTKGNLGLVYAAKGEWGKAISNFSQALQTFEQMDDIHAVATTSHNLGLIYGDKGEWDVAISYHKQALQKFTEMGNIHAVAQVRMGLGRVYGDKGELDKAIFYHKQALQTFKQIGDNLNMAFTYTNLGIVYQCMGECDTAITFYKQALEIFEQVGDIHHMARTYNNLGLAYEAKNKWDTAISYHTQSLKAKEQLGDFLGIAHTYGNLGSLYQNRGEAEQAASYVAKAFLIFYKLNAVEAQHTGVYLAQILGSPEAANAYLHHFLQQPDNPTP